MYYFKLLPVTLHSILHSGSTAHVLVTESCLASVPSLCAQPQLFVTLNSTVLQHMRAPTSPATALALPVVRAAWAAREPGPSASLAALAAHLASAAVSAALRTEVLTHRKINCSRYLQGGDQGGKGGRSKWDVKES